MVSADVGVGENGAKVQTTQKYSFACPKAKLRNMHL
jgi:hypothetical protein